MTQLKIIKNRKQQRPCTAHVVQWKKNSADFVVIWIWVDLNSAKSWRQCFAFTILSVVWNVSLFYAIAHKKKCFVLSISLARLETHDTKWSMSLSLVPPFFAVVVLCCNRRFAVSWMNMWSFVPNEWNATCVHIYHVNFGPRLKWNHFNKSIYFHLRFIVWRIRFTWWNIDLLIWTHHLGG